MCGRYALFSPGQEIARWFGVAVDDLAPRYNIAPGQAVQAVRQRSPGARQLVPMEWGFLPPWSPRPNAGRKLINARMETAGQKPTFREAFRHRRCLLPANGYYEWKAEGGRKQPWYLEPVAEPFLAFAGIWSQSKRPEPGGASEVCCVILTTESRGEARRVHHRMPLMVPSDLFDAWLDPESREPPDLNPFTWHLPISARPVSRAVNSPAAEGAACLEPDSAMGVTGQLF